MFLESTPMSHRNFPPSFWNSDYVAPPPPPAAVPSTSGLFHHPAAGPSTSSDLYADPYAAAARGSSWGSTHWPYGLPSQPYPHRSLPDLAYSSMPSTSRGYSQYSPLLLQGMENPSSRLQAAQCSVKSEAASWTSTRPYPEGLPTSSEHPIDASYTSVHPYPAMSGGYHSFT